MLQLPLHQRAGTRHDRGVGAGQCEQFQRVLQRRQGVAQLVPEDCQELILALVGCGQLLRLASQPFLALPKAGDVGAAPAFRAIALRGGGAEEKTRDRDDSHEQGHLQEAALHPGGHERAAAVEGRDDGHRHCPEDEGRRTMLPQPQRRPDDGREDQVVHGIGCRATSIHEHRDAQDQHRQHQQHRLPEPVEAPFAPRLIRPHEQERRDHQIAHGIADPPSGPGSPIRAPGRQAGGAKGRDTDGRADQGAQARREEKQGRDIVQAPQRRLKSDSQQQRCADDRLQGVPEGNACRCQRWRIARHVGRERADQYGGPEAAPAQHEQGKGDSGVEPHHRYLLGHRGKLQAQLARRVVHERYAEQLQQVRRPCGRPRLGR